MLIALLAVVLGLLTGVVSSLFTGVAIPLITLAFFKFGLVSLHPMQCLMFVICAGITSQVLQVATAHKSSISTLDTNLENVQKQNKRITSNRELVSETLRLSQSMKQSVLLRVYGLRLGVLLLGIPVIIGSKLFPLEITSILMSAVGWISVPVLVLGLAVSIAKTPRIAIFIALSGVIVWLILNSPASSTAPNAASISMVFSAGLSLFSEKYHTSIKLRDLGDKYVPKMAFFTTQVGFKEFAVALLGGVVAGMSPSFASKVLESESNPSGSERSSTQEIKREIDTYNNIIAQGMAETLSLVTVLAGASNTRTSLSADTYSMVSLQDPLIMVLGIFLIELAIRFSLHFMPVFVDLLNSPITELPNSMTVVIPNTLLILLVIPWYVAIPGLIASVAIGALHKSLDLSRNDFILALAIPTLLIMTPLNAIVVNAIF